MAFVFVTIGELTTSTDGRTLKLL